MEKISREALGNTTRFASAPTTAEQIPMSVLLKQKWKQKKEVDAAIKRSYKLAHDFGRVVRCSRAIKDGDAVRIVRSGSSGHAAYHNLLTCGNVWLCPVCRAKIQARRGEEIAKAVDWAYGHGYKVIMITYTQPHHLGQPLAALIGGHCAAMRKFKSGRWYQGFKAAAGVVGSIRCAEVTYSAVNGWHWHSHELLICDAHFKVSDMVLALKARWVDSCERAGLYIPDKGAMMSYGLDVMDNCHASDYLTKLGKNWGVDKEIAKSSRKKGAGCDPFAVLQLPNGDRLFAEYALATAGRAQLVWSRGLKAAVGVANVTDEQLADSTDDITSVIAEVSRKAWEHVLDEGAEAVLLHVATVGGFDAVRDWFERRGLGAEVARGSLFDIFGDTVFDDVA